MRVTDTIVELIYWGFLVWALLIFTWVMSVTVIFPLYDWVSQKISMWRFNRKVRNINKAFYRTTGVHAYVPPKETNDS